MKKGFVSIFFVLLGTTALLVNAFNQYGSAGGSDNSASAAESVSFIENDKNKIYDGSETDLLSWDEAVETVRAHMVQRDTSFSLYVEPTDNGAEIIKDIVTAHTGVPDEGDYLNRNLRHLTPAVYRRLGDDGTSYDFYKFTADYNTTKEQEDYVTSQINEVLTQLGVYTMNNDLQKITAIYNWITDNVTYDYYHYENDSSYLLQYTAYAALHEGTSVCQGCATLLYRMILTAGIDCRCVGGDGHVWNIIALDGIYYNADVTWDLGVDPENYSYFLKGSVSFGENHIRLAEYDTDLFRSTYFVPDQDYILPNVETVETEDDTIIDDMIIDEPITQDNNDDDTGTEDIVEKNREEIEDEAETETETEDPYQYITSLSEIPDSSMERMKNWAVNVCFSDFFSGVSKKFNPVTLDYIGSYFMMAREGTNTDVQNRIILVYKVTVNLIGKDESGEVTFNLLEYYTYCEFHNAEISNNEVFIMDFWDYSMCENTQTCSIMDYSQPEESNQVETILYFGYSDLNEACNDIVSAYAGQYDYESTV